MIKIVLLSDTHGYLDDQLLPILKECDEIWHAGDIGSLHVVRQLFQLEKKVRAVSGNIDDAKIRMDIPDQLEWELEEMKFFMIHIGGYPGHYAKGIKNLLREKQPQVFICGHSHILKIMFDQELNLLHLNPGACGKEGFHQVRTALKFTVREGRVHDMAVIELGKRGAIGS